MLKTLTVSISGQGKKSIDNKDLEDYADEYNYVIENAPSFQAPTPSKLLKRIDRPNFQAPAFISYIIAHYGVR